MRFWLGWFSSSERFFLLFEDFDVTETHNYASLDLHLNVGAVCCRLLPETKINRSACAYVVIAYETFSGLQLGWWWHCVLELHPVHYLPSHLVFVGLNGVPWN